MVEPQVSWDQGTAYELFLSLYVLHKPDKFGLRPSWAAGVRSRLPGPERKTLEDATLMFGPPLHWVFSLSEPKDCATALWALRQLKPADRLPVLTLDAGLPAVLADFIGDIGERGSWTDQDAETLRELSIEHLDGKPSQEEVTAVLDGWAHKAEFGERYLEAVQAYFQVFFAEEEDLIGPGLQVALGRAREMAEDLTLDRLIETLSQGVQIPRFLTMDELTFVPSYWMTPLIYMAKLSPKHPLIAFGARPPGASLIPGEVIPDALLQSLKALADPTRLRILRYLAQEPLTPAELSRRLRLRAPTVIHHLSALRVAGLIRFAIQESDERRYTARLDAIQNLPALMEDFIYGENKGKE